mgnify:CR=1 FL=1
MEVIIFIPVNIQSECFFLEFAFKTFNRVIATISPSDFLNFVRPIFLTVAIEAQAVSRGRVKLENEADEF